MSGEGGTSCEVELVTCTLSELSSCLCLHEASVVEGSSRRKRTSDYVDIPPEDIFLSTKRTLLINKPTLIDRLIFWHRTALAMGPKKVGRGGSNVSGVKRKREPEPSSSAPPKKRALLQKKETLGLKKIVQNAKGSTKKVGSDPGAKRYSTRKSQNKARVPLSLRSGRKIVEILKKKKLKAKNEANSASASSEALSIKTDDPKNLKKESNFAKKRLNVPVKKETSTQTKPSIPQTKGVNKKIISSVSEKTPIGDDSSVKKKRRKRKRCSMWKGKAKKVQKKDSDVAEVEGSSEEEDDDEAGVMSDVSLLSTATLDSSLSAAPPISVKEERLKEERDVAIKHEEEPSTSMEIIKVEENPVKIEPVKIEEINVNEESPETARIPDVETVSADAESTVSEQANVSAEPQLIVNANPEPIATVDHETIESTEVESVTAPEEDTFNIDSVSSITDSSEFNLQCTPTQENSSNDKPVCSKGTSEQMTKLNLSVSLTPVEDNELILDKLSSQSVITQDDEGLNELGNPLVNSDAKSEVIIAKCETLADRPPLDLQEDVITQDESDKPVYTESCDDPVSDSKCDKVTSLNVAEDIQIQNEERTEVPEQVPLRSDKETVEGAENVVENESELRRDADSTTCDNPRGMDDSFGDLSLYVTEDDLTGSKEHDEELPDSTNISQSEPCINTDEELQLSKLKVEKTETEFLDTDTVDPSDCISEEQKQMKESVLQALGLKSLSNVNSEASEEKPAKRSDGYTGTLKAVIKLNRTGDKKHMVYKRAESDLASSDKLEYRICSEVGSEETKKLVTDPTEESEDDGMNEDGSNKESKLIIPEKSSSFSIHPGRLCSDVCSYCFGKFGSLDTPCHIAQLKGEERQKKILENEAHLTGESCLCDACYRYVDRKANFPEKLKVGRLKPPAQASVCCVTHCSEPATRTIKRKWLIKLKKSITNKLNIDMEKLGHGVYYPFCTHHHYWVEYFTICGICRKRLNRNNLFSLGAEADRLNLMLAEDGIPARLSVNLFLCKLCRYYADLRLKYPDPTAIPTSNQNFYKNYRRKILMSLDLPVSDSDDELLHPQDEPKKNLEGSGDDKADEDVMSLSGLATLLGEQPQQQARIQVKFGNVNIGTLSNLNIGQQGGNASSAVTAPTGTAATNTGVNGSSSHHKNEPTYPEVSLIANFEYQGPNTPDGSWERYQSTLQFDKKTKQLWTELQRPYGSQTSFLRHLVMLERVWRDGYLVLAPDADEAASRYITSARNRIRAFETQGPKMSTSVTTTTAPPSVPVATTSPSISSAPISRPTTSVSARKPPPPGQTFPFLTNTGEIEVTPIRSKASPIIQQQLQQQPLTAISKSLTQSVPVSISSIPKGGVGSQLTAHHSLPQQLAFNQKMNPPRKITPLDRAKSLVRMAPMYQQIQQHPQSGVERRGMPGPVRYMTPGSSVSSIPPLVRLPQTQPTQYYQQHPPQMSQQPQIRLSPQLQIQQHINMQQQSYFLSQQPQPQPRMALPKLPRHLTVVSMPARPSIPQAITLSHSGITIEKQVAPTRTSTLPVERPSISVFREPATP